ncbi:MAG: V-type ATP synthase subunit E family protein [Thermoplasmata archaeon]
MSLESLVAEIRTRGQAELGTIEVARAAEAGRIAANRDTEIAALQLEATRLADAEAARERAQRIAAAKLKARKLLYEAREARLEQAIQETRTLLRTYADSDEYPATLKRMFEVATNRLGKQIRVLGRSSDASKLAKVAGKSVDATPLPILGGLVAETSDGSRRLNLSFDELLRLHEDRVRELLS